MSDISVTFGEDRWPRRPSLTPLVDVVFLLLVFFMLAARFGTEVAVPIGAAAGGVEAWEGPPRLVTVGPGTVRLNGQSIAAPALASALAPLMPTLSAPVILRAEGDARLQDVLTVASGLRAAGISTLVFAR
ncbi:MAG: biopolymer transporter ExbD [Pseudomonadota bacterium]